MSDCFPWRLLLSWQGSAAALPAAPEHRETPSQQIQGNQGGPADPGGSPGSPFPTPGASCSPGHSQSETAPGSRANPNSLSPPGLHSSKPHSTANLPLSEPCSLRQLTKPLLKNCWHCSSLLVTARITNEIRDSKQPIK